MILKSRLILMLLILGNAILAIVAHADCPDLTGEYLCNGGDFGVGNTGSRKTLISQSPISNGTKFTVQTFLPERADPDFFVPQDYIANGEPDAENALYVQGGGLPKTSCTSLGFECSVSYLYWGINPVHESDTYEKQDNGDIKVVKWRYQGIDGHFPGFPRRVSYFCTKVK